MSLLWEAEQFFFSLYSGLDARGALAFLSDLNDELIDLYEVIRDERKVEDFVLCRAQLSSREAQEIVKMYAETTGLSDMTRNFAEMLLQKYGRGKMEEKTETA